MLHGGMDVRRWRSMKLEHFGMEPAKSVLLVYEATFSEIESLITSFSLLGSENPRRTIEVTELPGCEGVDGCSLVLRRSNEDLGVEPVAGAPNGFQCSLSRGGWTHAIGMLEPFRNPQQTTEKS